MQQVTWIDKEEGKVYIISLRANSGGFSIGSTNQSSIFASALNVLIYDFNKINYSLYNSFLLLPLNALSLTMKNEEIIPKDLIKVMEEYEN